VRRSRGAFAAVLVAVMLVAGCSAAPGEGASVAAPLSLEQASLLADALFRNREMGGARFVVTARDSINGATVVLEGEVDWTTGHGVAVANGLRDPSGVVLAVAWTREAVAEQRAVGEPFALREVDTAGRTVDRLIAIVLGLATERPDNAQLVLQKPDAGFVRRDVLRGMEVEVLRYSERTLLWIDPTSGDLLRFEGSDRSGASPVVVDLLTLGPVRVELPAVVAAG
jgi:predicted small secreted protein